MRISQVWLAAASLVGIATADTITFTDSDFTNGGYQGSSVYMVQEDGLSATNKKTFHFSTDGSTLALAEVVLYVDMPGTVLDTFPLNSASSSTPTTTTAPTAVQSLVPPQGTMTKPPKRQDVALMPVPFSVSGLDAVNNGLLSGEWIGDVSGSVTINDLTSLKNYAAREMYFGVNWASGGHSYSRNFTVAFGTFQANGAMDQYRNPAPVLKEDPGSSGDVGTPGKTMASTSSGATATSQPTVAGSGSSSGGASSSSGLSTGAIAGIAVAAVLVGIALIGGLVFMIIRRRRQRDGGLSDDLASGGAGYGSGRNRTPELIAAKEANAGMGVDVSPHSPYSDDGLNGGASAAGTGMLANNAHGRGTRGDEMAFVPYSDRDHVSGANREVVPGPSAKAGSVATGEDGGSLTATGTHGGPSNPAVSHLVEEGMTEEEIRRLEEEERELDQAIEQAGAGRGR